MKITINITKKIIFRVFYIILISLTLSIIILYFQKYNASELTSHSIICDLKQIENENIFDYNTTDYLIKSHSNFDGCFCLGTFHLQPDYILTSADKIVNSKNPKVNCCELDFEWYINNFGKESISIVDLPNKINFSVNKNLDGITYDYDVSSNMEIGSDYNIKPNQVIKIFVKQILDSHEFILLKTDSDSNYDYLIKELDDKFLIYTIPNHIENPHGIWVRLYSKRKYFTQF